MFAKKGILTVLIFPLLLVGCKYLAIDSTKPNVAKEGFGGVKIISVGNLRHERIEIITEFTNSTNRTLCVAHIDNPARIGMEFIRVKDNSSFGNVEYEHAIVSLRYPFFLLPPKAKIVFRQIEGIKNYPYAVLPNNLPIEEPVDTRRDRFQVNAKILVKHCYANISKKVLDFSIGSVETVESSLSIPFKFSE